MPVTQPNTVADRLSTKDTSVVLLGGETFTAPNRRIEMLRKLSAQAFRLRGGRFTYSSANNNWTTAIDLTKDGRGASLEALLTRMGIIPILSVPTGTTLHMYVQSFPAQRASEGAVTVTGATTSAVFNYGDPAVDKTFAGTGAVDLAAASALDPNAVGAARPTVL